MKYQNYTTTVLPRSDVWKVIFQYIFFQEASIKKVQLNKFLKYILCSPTFTLQALDGHRVSSSAQQYVNYKAKTSQSSVLMRNYIFRHNNEEIGHVIEMCQMYFYETKSVFNIQRDWCSFNIEFPCTAIIEYVFASLKSSSL